MFQRTPARILQQKLLVAQINGLMPYFPLPWDSYNEVNRRFSNFEFNYFSVINFLIVQNKRVQPIRNCWASSKHTESVHFIKMQSTGCLLRRPLKIPNLSLFSVSFWNRSYFCVNRSASYIGNAKMGVPLRLCRSTLRRLNDALVCLLFRPYT